MVFVYGYLEKEKKNSKKVLKVHVNDSFDLEIST